MSGELAKGELTEEVLRGYFLELGYYVARGVKYVYSSFEITDVDLFLYSKASPFTRERTNVDVKRKKTPQAIERIFWARGLQEALGFERCIVATTDTRTEVPEFGRQNNIAVLDGDIVNRILERTKKQGKRRLFEEELLSMIGRASIGELYGDWRKDYEASKSQLLQPLNFNTCNRILETIQRLLDFVQTSDKTEQATRLLYLVISHLLVVLDYALKDMSVKSEETRIRELAGLIRYGESGREKAREVAKFAESVLASMPEIRGRIPPITALLDEKFTAVRAEVLAEYLARQQNITRLFSMAIAFEGHGFSIDFKRTSDIGTEEKALIGLLCDFYGVDRKSVL